jgi:DNA processing protein
MITLTLGDEGYPADLRQIHGPPARLFVQGTIPRQPMIAIVGSRRATPYGLRVAHRVAHDLSQRGVVVVSGLARGIDAAAHRGALTGPTPTVAVMATGLDRVYPPEHAELASAIARTGALVTEAPEGTAPVPSRFPMRNRIISGMSKGVLVVEAAARSGALITARLAGDEGREVFAVPGSVENPLTEGTHGLLRDGATLVRDVEDIVGEFPTLPLARVHARACTYARTRADSGPQDRELADVWELLELDMPRHHDEVARQLGISASELNRRLTLLEMGKYIIGDAGGLLRRSTAS